MTLDLWGPQDLFQALRLRSVLKSWFHELLGLKIAGNVLPACPVLRDKLLEGVDTCFLLFSASEFLLGPADPSLGLGSDSCPWGRLLEPIMASDGSARLGRFA